MNGKSQKRLLVHLAVYIGTGVEEELHQLHVDFGLELRKTKKVTSPYENTRGLIRTANTTGNRPDKSALGLEEGEFENHKTKMKRQTADLYALAIEVRARHMNTLLAVQLRAL